MTLTEFLLARIAEDEATASHALAETPEGGGWGASIHVDWSSGRLTWSETHAMRHHPGRVLAECEAKRRIVEWHKSWPVLAQTPLTFEPINNSDPSTFAMRASQQMAWLTEQEYRDRFGSEPPTGPVLRMLALPYADHPDYREEWRPTSELRRWEHE